MKRQYWIALLVVIVALGLWFARVFPDPYHRNGNVNFYEWVYRELDELVHGEK